MNRKVKSAALWLAQVAVVSSAVMFCAFPVSCKINEKGIRILTGDFTAPTLRSIKTRDERSVEMNFSKNVKIKNALVMESTGRQGAWLDAESVAEGAREANVSYEGENTVAVSSADGFALGKKYEICAVAEDDAGNTLTFCVPFVGYNARVPSFVICSVHPGYATETVKSTGKKEYKTEFAQLYMLSDGNLSGLSVRSAKTGGKRLFALPAAEVSKGDIVTIHLRKAGDGCVNETGKDKSLAHSRYSSKGARDLWIDNDAKFLDESEDVLAIQDEDGKILDAVMYSQASSESWKSEMARSLAEEAAAAGVWEGGGIEKSARLEKKLTAAHMLKRSGCRRAADSYGRVTQSASLWRDAPFSKKLEQTVLRDIE